jgi:hypothetical protein
MMHRERLRMPYLDLLGMAVRHYALMHGLQVRCLLPYCPPTSFRKTTSPLLTPVPGPNCPCVNHS